VRPRLCLVLLRKISPPPGFDHRIVHPVGSSLYRLSYPGPHDTDSGEPELTRRTGHSATWSTINLTWTALRLNRDKKPVTDRLSSDASRDG
jgi:hypothetical protein